MYFTKTRVLEFSGQNAGWSYRINFPILNSLSDAVEFGGCLKKSLETNFRRGNFVVIESNIKLSVFIDVFFKNKHISPNHFFPFRCVCELRLRCTNSLWLTSRC